MADKFFLLLWFAPLAFALGWIYSWLERWNKGKKPAPNEHRDHGLWFLSLALWMALLTGDMPDWFAPYQETLIFAGGIGLSIAYLIHMVRSDLRPKRKPTKMPKRRSGTELRAPPETGDT